MFAKSASAATAALGFAGYLLHAMDIDGQVIPLALLAVVALTVIVLNGIRSSNRANAVIVAVTIAALLAFVLAGVLFASPGWKANWTPFLSGEAPVPGLLEATALMFVAFTGYCRIATLGEEVHEPRITIPKAIVATLWMSAALYLSVGAVAVSIVGASRLAGAAQTEVAPLQIAAEALDGEILAMVVTVGAITAMLSVLLNLILGLSRMLLAMGRRGDVPSRLSSISAAGTPVPAVIAVAIVIGLLVLVGDVKLTWSFSAFTVLAYYAITNFAALRLPREQQMFSPAFAWGGLVSCAFLAFWVEWKIWVFGLALIAAGLIWHATARKLRSAGPNAD